MGKILSEESIKKIIKLSYKMEALGIGESFRICRIGMCLVISRYTSKDYRAILDCENTLIAEGNRVRVLSETVGLLDLIEVIK